MDPSEILDLMKMGLSFPDALARYRAEHAAPKGPDTSQPIAPTPVSEHLVNSYNTVGEHVKDTMAGSPGVIVAPLKGTQTNKWDANAPVLSEVAPATERYAPSMGGPKPGPTFNPTGTTPGWGNALVAAPVAALTEGAGGAAPNPQVAFGYAPTKGGASMTVPVPITPADIDKLEKQGAISQVTAEDYRKKLAAGKPIQGVAQPSVVEVASGKGEAKSGQPNKIIAAAKGEGTAPSESAPLFGVAPPAKPLSEPRSAAEAAKAPAMPVGQSPAQPAPPEGSWLHALGSAFKFGGA